MNITLLGHAGLKVETAGATVMVDPWMSPEGAFQASWFQYPDNQHLIEPSLFRPTAVVISHEHMDHVDPWYLAQVPSDVPVFVPRYDSPALRQKLLSAGPRRIIQVPPWETAEIATGTSVFFAPEKSPLNHDSAMVITGDGSTLLNQNDARLTPAQARDIRRKVGGAIDVLTLQGTGASWYPICYDYPEERKLQLSRQKRLSRLKYAGQIIREVEPTV